MPSSPLLLPLILLPFETSSFLQRLLLPQSPLEILCVLGDSRFTTVGMVLWSLGGLVEGGQKKSATILSQWFSHPLTMISWCFFVIGGGGQAVGPRNRISFSGQRLTREKRRLGSVLWWLRSFDHLRKRTEMNGVLQFSNTGLRFLVRGRRQLE
ncbi:hypothetical protein F4804DRAFT_123021 [Jackrogersella minutella]|nr:hypothetical protein F4804DRAFT_123021 [Jackrogersella minutella]